MSTQPLRPRLSLLDFFHSRTAPPPPLDVSVGSQDSQPRASVKEKKPGSISAFEKVFAVSQSRTKLTKLPAQPKALTSSLTVFTPPPHPTPITESEQERQRSNHSRLSSLAQLKQHRNSMFAAKGRQSRHERTFIGSKCAACEEPLEHTLRGERILQLSCGHVSHEACFYEYIREFEAQHCPTCSAPLGLDTSRGGSIDFVSLNRLVRSAQSADFTDRVRSQYASPAPWDVQSTQQTVPETTLSTSPPPRDHLLPERMRLNGYSHDRQQSLHTRKRSGDTGTVSANDFSDANNTVTRRNDYDTESRSTASRHSSRNPVPAPIVTVRSEFPTLTKSRQQQSLTCLVTVEVVDKKWQPNVEDLRSPPPVPTIPEEAYSSPAQRSKTGHISPPPKPVDSVHEDEPALEEVKDELYKRCENWHGLDFARFGKLILHGTMRVSKDRLAWQDLECYLFTEMLICVKARKSTPNASQQWETAEEAKPQQKVALKGSILIKKHLKQVENAPDTDVLTLTLSVPELPHFYLHFKEHPHLLTWRRTLLNIIGIAVPEPQVTETDVEYSGTDDEEGVKSSKRLSSVRSSTYGGTRSHATAPTEYSTSRVGFQDMQLSTSTIHVPVDVVVVIPVSSSMQGLKINVLRDSLRFLVANLGQRDRMGLVTFGAGGSGVPLVGMTSKNWNGWSQVLESIRPVGQKNIRADAVDGANVAMDLLMQRKSPNALSSILVISDSGTADHERIDFVVSRAEAAKVAIHSFGLGLTHKPDILVELATKTKASYIYVKDWMMLRECLAGCMGALQSTSHQNVKLKLRLPEGSPAKFVKISGALQVSRRASGRDAEIALGDLRFGDKRDILVQLAVMPDASTPDAALSDPWDNIISGLEALSGPLEQEETRHTSVEELPLLQADLSWGDLLREGQLAHSPRPSLLAITMLPLASKRNTHLGPNSPPIPPHPSIVQRRMELLTSDMLSRALTLVSRGQSERAHHLLAETRSILKGLTKGSLPPLPPPPASAAAATKSTDAATPSAAKIPLPEGRRTPSPPRDVPSALTPSAGIDTRTLTALDAELESSLEWISHPAVFVRDSRKAVLQAIGVISSQRAYAFRSPTETLWASRISGVKRLSESSRDWRETGDDSLTEE